LSVGWEKAADAPRTPQARSAVPTPERPHGPGGQGGYVVAVTFTIVVAAFAHPTALRRRMRIVA
jgi:hypothetical protein